MLRLTAHDGEGLGFDDIVITADIPLAAQVVSNSGIAIGPRGELFDEGNVQAKLASRNLMDHLRSSGLETEGPKPINKKDVQAFANQLDRRGFSLVEILSPCPVYWRMSPTEAMKWIEKNVTPYFPLGVLRDRAGEAK